LRVLLSDGRGHLRRHEACSEKLVAEEA